jgi:serine/threonine protein kinase, bacterial
MGVVWRGRDRITGDICAIKLLRPELAADPEAVARFVRERTALVKFRHPNVVTLRDMIVEGDVLALVMDFIDGGDLGSYRHRCGGTLPPADAAGITASICDALAAAHAAGIVHRDLKPANVLLDAGRVRLADFGIARVVGESRATSTGMLIGTIGFMAPEVINGGEPTAACDMYALGITLYELLSGIQPFTGQPVAVMRGHLDTAPQRPDRLPEPLWRMIAACLAKDPTARPTAAQLAAALRDPRATAGSPAVPPMTPVGLAEPAGVTGLAGRTGVTGPRLARPTADTGQHTVTGIGWLTPAGPAHGAAPAPAGSTWPTPSPPAALPSRSPLAGRRRTWAVIAGAVLVFVGVAGTYLVISPSGGAVSGAPVIVATQSQTAQSLAAVPTGTGTGAGAAGTGTGAGAAGTGTGAGAAGTGTAGAVASQRASTSAAASTAQPSTTAAVTQAAPATTQQASTPAATHSVAAAPGPTGPNLVADGDFTDSSLSAWDNFVSNTVVVGSGAEGGNSAQMNGNPTAGVTQIVTGLTPGHAYQLTGWVSSSTGGGTYIGAKAYDSTAGVSHAGSASSWTEETMNFVEGAGKTTAEIFCWQAVAGTGYCSNVTLQALG